MNKRTDFERAPRIEGSLTALFSAATPDAAFVANLERQLLAQGTILVGQHAAGESPLRRWWARWAQPSGQRRWATIALSLLLAAVVALAAVGPRRAWAEVQRLLGYVPGIGFVDLGDDPQVGDHWPLDIALDVAGFPVHISGARLIKEQMCLQDGPVQRTLLQFDVDPAPEQAGRTLQGIHLDSEAAAYGSGPGGYDFRTRIVRTSLELREGQPIPTGPIQVRVWSASLFIRGPWHITWTVR